jgi:hypothetical protein
MANASSRDDIARLGKECYEKLQPQVETPAAIGKLIAIDITTGDYEIGEDILEISARLRAMRPDGELWAERIGFNAVYAVGGTLRRSVERHRDS